MNQRARLVIHEIQLLALRCLSFGSSLAILLGLAGIILPLFDNVDQYGVAVDILLINMWINSLIESVLPTFIYGHSITDWVVILTAFLLKFRLNIAARGQMAQIVRLNHLSVDKILPKVPVERLEDGFWVKSIRAARDIVIYRKPKIRRLQSKITKLRAELDRFGRELVFLSIDVVDSSGMKKRGDQSSIAVYFDRYQEFVRQILKENEMLKASWTPDGVMVCFKSYPDAFNAAKNIIINLTAFNQEQCKFGHEFRVRCGINGGFVLFDEALKMEEIASHAIDLAAHVQKEAPPNHIYVTRHTIEPKNLVTNLAPTAERIDGCEVFMWNKSGFSLNSP